MSSSPNLLTLSLTFSLLSLLTSSSSSASSIHDVLRSHGLPIGLFPQTISNFTFDTSIGRFELRLHQSCDSHFETHVRYHVNVSGSLTYGQISELSGVTAQDLFLWFPVKAIRVDIPSSGLIYFDVGVVFKQFSLSLFETPRDCTVTDSTTTSSSPVHLLVNNDGQFVQNQYGKLVNALGQENLLRAAT